MWGECGVAIYSDAFVGLYQHYLDKSAGPFVLAVLQFYAGYALYKAGGSEIES